jgi:hypothetical protein
LVDRKLTEMGLSADSAWSRQVAAIRGDVPNLCKSEIEATPGRIWRLLRPLLPDEIAPGSLLDAIDLSDAEMLVEFVCTCRGHVINEVQQYLESTDEVLLDALRNAGDTQCWRCRPAVPRSQIEAAVRFYRTVFGSDDAVLWPRQPSHADCSGRMRAQART